MRKSPNNYRLVPTNLLFELWLVMHFQEINAPLTKAQTYKALARHLNIEYYGSSGDKNNSGFIRCVTTNGDIGRAISNAARLVKDQEVAENLDCISSLNPVTYVHQIIEKLCDEISNAKNE